MKKPSSSSSAISICRSSFPGEAEAASAPERELAVLLERLTDLESATSALSESLARFRDERRSRLGAAEEELFAAKRLEARLSRLFTEAEAWDAGFSRRSPRRGAARSRSARRAEPLPLPPPAPGKDTAPEPWVTLKDLYRALVRMAHPDRAKTDAERARKSELLSRVNAAYARGDRVLLELLYSQASSPLEPREIELGERKSHAERRLVTLGPLVSSLEKELGRLRASSAFRELEAMRRESEAGGDYFGDVLARVHRETSALLAAALDRAAALEAAVRAFPRRERVPVAPGGDFLVRKAVARLGGQRPTEEARRFESELGKLASTAPWQVALSVFAFFGEVSVEPAPGLSSLAAARDRYERLRTSWPSAPPFERAILRLPPFLEVGLRAYPKRLGFGIQLKQAWAVGSVGRALGTPELLPLSRRVLEVMGPSERCAACGKVSFLVHLFRTRGTDEIHGLVCPVCAAVQRSYRTFGASEGLEALAPYAVALGSVDEQAVRIANTTLVFGLRPAERKALTAGRLIERIAALHFEGLKEGLSRHLRIRLGQRPLSPSSPVRAGATVRLVLTKDAPLDEKELVASLRSQARARYTRGTAPVTPRSRAR
jgi:hypothetical protein